MKSTEVVFRRKLSQRTPRQRTMERRRRLLAVKKEFGLSIVELAECWGKTFGYVEAELRSAIDELRLKTPMEEATKPMGNVKIRLIKGVDLV